MHRTLLRLALVVALVGVCAAPARAGGWATVRLDEPPAEVVAGSPWRVGFRVLQHDVRPTNDVTPRLKARHRETGEAIEAVAAREGDVGHFVAEVTFPRAGEWKWSITPESFPTSTSFSTLNVSAVGGDGASEREVPGTPSSAGLVEEVVIRDSVFQPARLSVPVGAKVAWRNAGVLAHEVTSDELEFADSGLLQPGERFEQTFDRPGTYAVRCGPHVGMESTIVVE